MYNSIGDNMKYVLVSDFDNTLYVRNQEVLNKNKEAIKRFRNEGNIIVIATGRSRNTILELLTNNDISYDYLICNNGAETYDNNLNLINRNPMDGEIVKNIKEIAKKNNNYLLEAKSDDDKYTNCIFIKRENNLDEILNYVKDITYNYFSANWLNIVDKKTSKVMAVKALEEKLFSKDKIFTIGDAINDKEMIEYYNGAKMAIHEEILDDINCPIYQHFYEYIENILNN